MAGQGAGQGRIVTDADEIMQIAYSARRVAVLGIKTEAQAAQPAYHVPEYLQEEGVDIVPIPVYYPEATTILGKPVYRSVAAVPVPPAIDVLNIFRKPSDLMPHLPDILAASQLPKCVWLQEGITHPEFEQALADAGCLVVADRCLMVDHMNACKSRKFRKPSHL